MKLKPLTGEVNKKLDEFLKDKSATDSIITFGHFLQKYEVATWNWSEHIEDGYLRANVMYVRVSYLRGVVLLISIRSGAGWLPNTKDQEYILNYLMPLTGSLGIGEPEEIYVKCVGTRVDKTNVLNLEWRDKRVKSLVAAIAHVFNE